MKIINAEDEILTIEDNYVPEHLQGKQLYIGIFETDGLYEPIMFGGQALDTAAMSLTRAEAQDLYDWLGRWLGAQDNNNL